MVTKKKHKHVDSIVSPVEVAAKEATSAEVVSEQLLGRTQPGVPASEAKDFVVPAKKWYIWHRTPKEKAEKAKVVELTDVPANPNVSIPPMSSLVTNPGISSGPTVEDPRLAGDDKKKKAKKVSAEIAKKPRKSWFAKEVDAAEAEVMEVADKNKFFKRHHKIALAIMAITSTIIVLVGLLGGAVYAHQAIYQNRVFPGVTVWGEEVGGKSVKEVQQLITKKAKDYSIVIKGPDQDYKATVQDLGIIFNSDTMALSAYSRGRSDVWWDDYLTRARLLLTEIKWGPWQKFIRSSDLAISPSYSVNQEKLMAYVTKVADNIKIQAQDSEVSVADGITQLKPAIYGRDVELNKLRSLVLANITTLTTKKIDVPTLVVKPAIVDTAAQEVMVQAQNVMSRPVVLVYKGTEYRPNQDTVGAWISFSKNAGDTKYTLVVDKAKMASYFSFLGNKINVYSTQRMVRVENGVKQTEAQAGVDGLLVDTDLLGNQIAATLPNQPSVRLEIPTYVDKFKTKYENVVIADWDKYVDINLSSQIMTACEKGGVNCRQWSITTGDDNHPSPVGTHLVLGRNANFYMTGGTPGVDYYKVWVDHAVWFTSAGHAIHDAHWRNGSFGGQDYHWNGSHGCINSPDDAAIFIYNWASVGTPVIVHY